MLNAKWVAVISPFLEVKKVLFYLLSDVTFFMQDILYNHVP